MILALFFTKGVSLSQWVNTGLIDREKLIYEEQIRAKAYSKIYWFTYGKDDYNLSIQLKKNKSLHRDIHVMNMPKYIPENRFGYYIYSLLVLLIYSSTIKRCNLIKTNQMNGSWTAVLSKLLFRKPLIVRTGYTLSIFRNKSRSSKINKCFISVVEKFAYKHADFSMVSSHRDMDYVIKKYNVPSDKITVVHNYIDNIKFRKIESVKLRRAIFVGRLTKQKNIITMLGACKANNIGIDLYGDGEDKDIIASYIQRNKLDAKLKGLVSNDSLPLILNQYKYYVLVSYYEGMPKTLLEAMACGCICIGTDVEGIGEVIESRANGLLSDSCNLNDIKNTIMHAVSMSEIEQNYMSNLAVNTVKDKFSLDAISFQERELIDIINNE